VASWLIDVWIVSLIIGGIVTVRKGFWQKQNDTWSHYRTARAVVAAIFLVFAVILIAVRMAEP
jgi:hypothetical protein